MGDDARFDEEESTATLVGDLADEIEAGTVPDAEVERLRTALLDGGSGALTARVEKLQRDVDEVLAYATALEEFLDEHGTGQQLIESVHDDVEEVRGEVGDLRADLEETRAELDEARTTADRTATRVDGVEDAVDETLAGVESELDRLDSEVESIQDWRRQLVSVLSGTDADGHDGHDGHDGQDDHDGHDGYDDHDGPDDHDDQAGHGESERTE
ncbi:MAG: hypothetical protein V5A44_04135 [Haloarculaceae archaeon]